MPHKAPEFPQPAREPEDLGVSGERVRVPVEAESVPISGPTIPNWKGDAPPRTIESTVEKDRERRLLQVMMDDLIAQAVGNQKLDTDAKKQLIAFGQTGEMAILFAPIAVGKPKLATALDAADLPKLWEELSGYGMKLVNLNKPLAKGLTLPSAAPTQKTYKSGSVLR